MDLKFEGMDQLLQRTKIFPKEVALPASRKAVRAGGKVIQAAMVAAAPVQALRTAGSNSLAPGAVQASIKTSTNVTYDVAEAVIGPAGKPGVVAGWVEYGHRLVKGGSSKVLANGKTRGRGTQIADVPPHPFLRPAFESSVDEAQDVMRETLLAELENA